MGIIFYGVEITTDPELPLTLDDPPSAQLHFLHSPLKSMPGPYINLSFYQPPSVPISPFVVTYPL
jgi:hypothetical protein